MSWTKITVRSMQELRLSKWGVGWGGVGVPRVGERGGGGGLNLEMNTLSCHSVWLCHLNTVKHLSDLSVQFTQHQCYLTTRRSTKH